MKPENQIGEDVMIVRPGETVLEKCDTRFIRIITEAGQDMHIAIRDISYIISKAGDKIGLCQCSDSGEWTWDITDPCAAKVWQWASENAIDLR